MYPCIYDYDDKKKFELYIVYIWQYLPLAV